MAHALIIAVHGILTRQTVADWPDHFDAWCERKGVPARVLKKEYLAGPFPLWNVLFRNRLLAKGLAAEIELFWQNFELRNSKFEIHFVSHSNGTDIALKTIKLLARRGIATKTFIAVGSVLKSDTRKSGIAELLHEGDLGRAVAYSSDVDRAIGVGRFTLGYGDLGRRGFHVGGQKLTEFLSAQSAKSADILPPVYTRWFNTFGHGEYFWPEHRERTFQLFVQDCGVAAPRQSAGNQARTTGIDMSEINQELRK